MAKDSDLAMDGGMRTRRAPWPARRLFGQAEKRAAMALFDQAIETGQAFGYGGPQEEAYCRQFAQFLGGGYADGVSSGTAAVYVALRCLELEPFSEVIVPPITDPGGVMPVPLMNCIPIVADAAPGSYNAGPRQVAARITPRTSAILVAHIAGLPADMPGILAVARRHKLPVVEDCAQAHGALCQGRPVGTFGDLAAFSTMSGKHHATGAQGGVVFTRREDLYWRARRYADRGKPFGLSGVTTGVAASLNLNLNELAAAIGRVQFRKLPRIVAARRRTALQIARRCQALRAVRMVTPAPGDEGSFWFLLFRLDLARLAVGKDTFVKALRAEGLPVDAGYLHVPSLAEWYKTRTVFGRSGLPWTSPLYKGKADAEYPVPNIMATDACHFRMNFHEKFGPREVRDIVAALRKVERAYLK